MTGPPPAGGRAAAGGEGLAVPSTPRSVGVVRRYALEVCRALGWDDAADTVALLVTEVATNALLHAYGPQIRVRVRERGSRLRVEVSDGSPALPAPRDAPAPAENGRGLALVQELAARWGVEPAPPGKTVWFEVGR